eukprot:gene19267-25904_t
MKDPEAISANRLAHITGPEVKELIGWRRDVPLQEERARLLREVGTVLLESFQGQASNLIEASGRSAPKLLELMITHFPGFRDQAVYKGRQVFFYKRAQIFVGDVYGAFQGEGAYGALSEIEQLTMFADYRVPVVLRVMDVLHFTPELADKFVFRIADYRVPVALRVMEVLHITPALADKMEKRQTFCPGSEEEIELRAASVLAVELFREAIRSHFGSMASEVGGGGLQYGLPTSVQLDWWMWEIGENSKHEHPPHHRTLTMFY